MQDTSSSHAELQKTYPEKLGSKTWNFLHELANGFDSMSRGDANKIFRLVNDLSDIYPVKFKINIKCNKCKAHFQKYVRRNKPYFKNGKDMRVYLCKFHNEVNKAQNKPEMDCENIN